MSDTDMTETKRERDALNVFIAEMDAAIADEVALAQDREFLRNRVRGIIARYEATTLTDSPGEPRKARNADVSRDTIEQRADGAVP